MITQKYPPTRLKGLNEIGMSFTKKRRFWTEVDVAQTKAGFVVRLDGRAVKTPGLTDLTLPTLEAANLVALEWDRVEGELRPADMSATRWANVSIDRVKTEHAQIVTMLVDYGASDLCCYRASHPEALVLLQSEAWDKPLKWVEQHFNAPLLVTRGVSPVAQPKQSCENLRCAVMRLDVFALAAFYDLVQISGSLVLALAVLHREMDAVSAWDASRVDENWQLAQWGEEQEAVESAKKKCASFIFADKLLQSVFVST